MVRTFSDGHNMGSIVKDAIRCDHCTHKRAIEYSSGVLYCWNCRLVKLVDRIDYASLKIDGIDFKDYPDFCDAYFSAGNYLDGKPLPEEVLEKLSEDSARVNEAVFNQLF